ncbi:M48 family metalloprotease [Pantoea ananatis]|uniref:M48 family metalloprotease n=1 Tax=Pantoea ananas TaxID=553 RepID=UPI0039B8E3F3
MCDDDIANRAHPGRGRHLATTTRPDGRAGVRRSQGQGKRNAYVRCVVNTLVAQLPEQWRGTGWETALFNDKEPNAFALPGGKVGVNSGIFSVAKNQDQLAAVLGHEIGHVISRHHEERITRQLGAQASVIGALAGAARSGRGRHRRPGRRHDCPGGAMPLRRAIAPTTVPRAMRRTRRRRCCSPMPSARSRPASRRPSSAASCRSSSTPTTRARTTRRCAPRPMRSWPTAAPTSTTSRWPRSWPRRPPTTSTTEGREESTAWTTTAT